MVWLCKTKIWWKSKVVLYGYRQFHCIVKKDDIYKDISEYVETKFDALNYELERPLPKGKNKKVIGLIKGGLGRNIMTKFLGLRATTYTYLIDYSSENKKAKGTKKCAVKRELKFESYKSCFEATQLVNKINHPEKNKVDTDSIKENHKEFVNKSIW